MKFSPAIQRLVDQAERAERAARRRGSSSRPATGRSRVRQAQRHADRPGAGAARRRQLRLTPEEKVRAVMGEFKRGTLRSSSGQVVTSRQQAIAIAMSEAGLSWKRPRKRGR